MRTLAAVVDRVGGPIVVRPLTLVPPKSSEVLVKVHAAGICRSDWHVKTGSTPHPLPVVLGHEGAGTVVECGPDVTHLKPGDGVILSWAPGCNSCYYCSLDRPALCEAFNSTIWDGVMADGTPRFFRDGAPVFQYCALGCFSEYTVVSAQACVPKPSGVPMSVAALIGCCVTTGIGAVLNTAYVQKRSSVAIFGVGGVGLSMVIGADHSGAEPIIAIDTLAERASLVCSLGATHFVQWSPDTLDQIRALTNGRGADFVFDATGVPEAQTMCLEATRPGGTAVLSGLAPEKVSINYPASVVTRKEKTIKGSYYGSAVPQRDFVQYAEWYREGILNLDPLLTKTYTVHEIPLAYEELGQGSILRGVVSFDADKASIC